MPRFCFVLEVLPGREDAYDEAHQKMSEKLRERYRSAGLSNYSVFRRGTLVIGVGESRTDPAVVLAELAGDPLEQDFGASLDGVVVDLDAAALPMAEEVWRLD